MKNLFFVLVTIFTVNSNAQIVSYCDSQVQKLASTMFQLSFDSEVIVAVDSVATHYVGRHTKMYTANVTSAQQKVSYNVQVFEFETPGTACEIDSIVKIY